MNERTENPFEPRLGRIRSGGNLGRGKTFMSKVSRTMERIGPSGSRRSGRVRPRNAKTYSRRVIVKARFVRSAMSSSAALAKHIQYIRRDSANRSEDKGRVFNAETDDADHESFVAAAKDDRHHFRLIVSPEDGTEMADMKPFVRDLVSTMEKDLGTKLEWVGAVHDNTSHPHVHIVIRGQRDDGRDLVMPRQYISHGIRQRAEELVTLELGPQTQLEKDVKLARQSGVERLTAIDRSLAKMRGEDGIVDLNHSAPRFRSVNIARLQKLKKLGLADQVGFQKWKLADGLNRTLKELGEQGDVIKQMHKAIGDLPERRLDPAQPFSPAAGDGPITGSILQVGVRGDMHDEPFMMIDGMDGRVIMTKLHSAADLDTYHKGMIVTISPPDTEPKASDKIIASVAGANDSLYSADLHNQTDRRASRAFVSAHIRRLEKLRRFGIVTRRSDGTWHVPSDYLDKVREYQGRQTGTSAPKVVVKSWTSIASQVDATGLTWLDQIEPPDAVASGFGTDLKGAYTKRQAVLLRRGLISSSDEKLDKATMEQLRQAGLEVVAADLAQELGKPYVRMPDHGTIEGVYRQAVLRPEGKFAVIDRQRGFSVGSVEKRHGSRSRAINFRDYSRNGHFVDVWARS